MRSVYLLHGSIGIASLTYGDKVVNGEENGDAYLPNGGGIPIKNLLISLTFLTIDC